VRLWLRKYRDSLPLRSFQWRCGRNSDVPVSSEPLAPSDSNCSPHESVNTTAVALSAENQLEQKTNAISSVGKAFAPIYVFSDYSTLQTQFALRLDLLRGPPKRGAFIKTNTRLAALSTLRI